MSNQSEPDIQPVHVTLVGGTGDGGISQQTFRTPAGQPDIIATLIPTALGLFTRWLDTFLNTFLAISGIGAITGIDAVKKLVPTHSALGASVFEEAVFYAFVAASFQLLKNIAVLVGKWKESYPLLGV